MDETTTAASGSEPIGAPVPPGAFEQLLYFFEDGGPVLYLLAAVSVLALTVILMKLFQFTALRVYRQGFVEPAMQYWQAGRTSEALALLQSQRNPVARVLDAALRGAAAGEASEQRLKEEVTRVAGLELDNLRSGLRLLAMIANLSPLIGLLGTVLGMINAFQALEAAGNRVDPAILSGGIWVALLTTAAGLIIAIPAAAAHNWMEGVVYRCQRAMEDAVTRLFTAAAAAPEPDPAGYGERLPQPAE